MTLQLKNAPKDYNEYLNTNITKQYKQINAI